MLITAAASESCVDDHDEVSLLQLRNKHLVEEAAAGRQTAATIEGTVPTVLGTPCAGACETDPSAAACATCCRAQRHEIDWQCGGEHPAECCLGEWSDACWNVMSSANNGHACNQCNAFHHRGEFGNGEPEPIESWPGSESSIIEPTSEPTIESSGPAPDPSLWPQLGKDHRKCSGATGHRVDPQVTECGSRMIDIDIAGKDMDGEYKLKKGRGAVYDGPSSLNLRYKKVATYDGMELDLKVVNMNEEYDPGRKKVVQGLYGASGFGVVSVRSNHASGFKFSLVKHGTDIEIPVPEFPVTLYDIDGGKGCAMRESVFANGYIYGKIGSNLVNITGGFRNKFPASAYEEASVDSPMSPDTLTEVQTSISAGYVFANTASFTVTFDASAGFGDDYPDLDPPVTKCGTDVHARWMIFSMKKLPCEGSYLPSNESTPDGHPYETVESQTECQMLAEEAGHPYYSFEPNQKKCFTSMKCQEPVPTDEDEPWKIFIDLWPKHNNTHVACKPTDGAPTVHSELKCQELAIERGHRFYSFLETTNQCVTSYDCGSPDDGAPPFKEEPWRIREEPWWPWGSPNRKCNDVDQAKPAPSQWACQRRAWSLKHGFYSWQPKTLMCATSEICDNPVPTDPEDEWRIHIERWPINGDPGDGTCGDEYIEGIPLGDGADCQSLCAGNDDCKHYCYLDGGQEGYCRTYGGECGSDGKKGGTNATNTYTCYDKPLTEVTTTFTPTTPGVTTVPPSVGPTATTPAPPPPTTNPLTTTPTTTEDEDFIQFEFPEGKTTTTTPSTTTEDFIQFEFPEWPEPSPSPAPGVIEDCCGHDVEENAIPGTCFSKIASLPLDSLHGRDASETFADNVHLNNFKYYLESCSGGVEECTYTELTDPDPQHHKFHVGKTRVKIEAYDIAGNKYECMRNVYVHDMEPPTFVFGPEQVHGDTGESYRQTFAPDSTTVRIEVDKETCNVKATETFSTYETLQGMSSSPGAGEGLAARDNCDVARPGDALGAEVIKKIYDSDGKLLYDSSSQDSGDESLITKGPGQYKMEIIAIDDFSEDLVFPSNRSDKMHTTKLVVDLELYDEAPPRDVGACPADMTGEKKVVIGPNETKAVVFWDVPNVTFDNCQHHQPPPEPTCVVDQLIDGVDRTTGQYGAVCHPGMTLDVGTHVIIYTFTDGYGNPPGGIECEFRVKIVQEEHPVTLTCPDDINITTLPMREFAIVTWSDPVAMQNGKALPQSHISYPQGVASGMPFPFGVTEITVRAEGHDYTAVQQGNQLQQWDECIFLVRVTDEENPKCDGREFRCNAASASAYPPMLKPYDICGGPQLQVELRPGYPTSFGYNTLGVSNTPSNRSCCASEMDVPHVCTAMEGTGTSYCSPSSR